jgi:hypothetical protein
MAWRRGNPGQSCESRSASCHHRHPKNLSSFRKGQIYRDEGDEKKAGTIIQKPGERLDALLHLIFPR